jgi:hypothetical protein
MKVTPTKCNPGIHSTNEIAILQKILLVKHGECKPGGEEIAFINNSN